MDDIVLYTIPDAPQATIAVNELETNSVILTFNNEMNEESVTNISNYSMEGFTIHSVEKSENSYIVLFDEALDHATEYTLNVNNVADAYGQIYSGALRFTSAVEDKLYIDEVKFFKDYGTETQYEIVDGYVTEGNISAVIENADNYSGKEQKLILLIALYENSKMVNVSSQEVTLADGESLQEALSAAIAVPQKTDGIKNAYKKQRV